MTAPSFMFATGIESGIREQARQLLATELARASIPKVAFTFGIDPMLL